MEGRDASRAVPLEASGTRQAPRGRGRVLGRYALYDAIASGGMATVHIGRLVGPAGFSRTVAIKRLHPHYSTEPEFVAMFLDEARLAARVQHPNVVPTLDVVTTDGEVFLVMEYVQGESLSRLLRGADGAVARPLEPRIAGAIAAGMLHGLHAAHEARGERAEALDIVHRDVSPQNVIVGVDGVPRILDFGIAKAAVRLQETQEGRVKGKLPYMAPEQLRGKEITRRVDVYAASVVLWEMLAGRRLFRADNEGNIVEQVLMGFVHPPSRFVPEVPTSLDDIVLRGLSRDAGQRFPSAQEMALAVEAALQVASASEVGAWVSAMAGATLDTRARLVAEIEGSSGEDLPTSAGDATGPAADATEPDRLDPAVASAAIGTRVDTRITSTTDSAEQAPRARVRVRWVTPAAILLAGGLVFAGLVTRRSREAPPSSPSAVAIPSASAEPSEPSAVGEAPAPPSVVPTVVSTSPSGSAAVAKPAPRRRAPTPRRDCSPPYTRDATGRIQWKMNCL